MRYLQRASACGLLVLLAVLGMSQPAPAPWPADGPDCPFTVRVAGELISVADAPDSERYIVSCRSEEARRQLAALVPSLQPLTQSMPLLVGTLTREELQALCQNPVAVAAIRYIERDEKVSIAGAEVSI